MKTSCITLLAATALGASLLSPSARAAEVWFNTDPSVDLTGKVIEAMDRTVAAAGDKPVEFDANVFAFTSDRIADEMLTLAKDHPNLSINVVTDWSSLAASGGRKGPFLERAVAGDYAGACNVEGGSASSKAACREHLQDLLGGQTLTNINVHYKKDDPYKWDASQHKAVYDHAKTQGLDHHKGMAILVDGVPTELVTGSFNWSKTANDSNYENLMHFTREVPAERELIKSFAAETRAMFHNAAISLSGTNALAYKDWLLKKYAFENGAGADPGPEPQPALAADDAIIATCPNPSANPTLEDLVNAVNGAVAVTGGTFAPDPDAGNPDALVAVNNATADELQSLWGIGPVRSQKILDWIAAHGPMRSGDDLVAAGVPRSIVTKNAGKLDFRFTEGFYSSHMMDCPDAGTGYAAMNAVKKTTVKNANDDGVTVVPGSLTAPAIDLFRRAKAGDAIKVAAYLYGPTAPEFTEMAAAVARGASVKVVLNKAWNGSAVSALTSLAEKYPGRVEVKETTHTMHEKFAVVGNDVFDGSSNLNESATERHSEDRFRIENDPVVSQQFSDEFDRLWSLGKPVVTAPAPAPGNG